ncbi:hypothetical protein ACC717_03465 [Rhizobium ruizarguesonis]|uniref:Uncharacterized protein n=1 Tax=Rhizobium ruizarguesonis TaxID=2081791 RepID=A0AB38I4Q7_9HYPH|nr:hypothetical protein [Rhizobium ruizarguesonis]TBB66145.1 hypothetical protein ELH42_08200 [Rhizobium ruizarguesonis]TBB70536.1 hypothetical protein ELH45_08250 [Rhizobium ruizarguesonis]TBC15618.1 hypothetical protein ELH40_12110 [Rhizobium ruizarguesonis]
MNSDKSANDPRGPQVNPSLKSGTANVARVLAAGRSASIWDRVIEEEHARIRGMCRMTYSADRNNGWIVGRHVGPTLLKLHSPTAR